MSLNKIKSKFEKGLITKLEYIKDMYSVHSFLFEYSEFINCSDVKRIQIESGKVIFIIKSIDGLKEVKIESVKSDARTTALEILNFGNYEGDDSKMLFKLIQKDDIVFDIGANIGWYSINFAKTLTEGKVYAFEPIPDTYKYLLNNLELNFIKNIHTYSFALSANSGEAEFFYNPDELGASSAKNIKEANNVKKVICKTITLDDFFIKNKIDKIDLIKCDVEGGEYFVFEGGKKIIKKYKPIVFTEMLRKWSAKFNYHPNKIIKLFSETGYKCFIVNNEKLREIKEIEDSSKETNFIFLHFEKHMDTILQYT